jgi:putative flippase GtrA
VFFHNKTNGLRILRFGIVGLGNTVVDFLAFFLLNAVGVPSLLAQVCSYTVGIVNSFVFNRRWTFQVARKTTMMEIWKFLFVNGFALLISSSLLFLLPDVYQLNLWMSKIFATGGGIIVNFMGSRLWVFPEKKITRGRIMKYS